MPDAYLVMTREGGGWGPVSNWQVHGVTESPSHALEERNQLLRGGEAARIFVDSDDPGRRRLPED